MILIIIISNSCFTHYRMCFKHDWKNFFFIMASSGWTGFISSNGFLPSYSKSRYTIELKRSKYNLLVDLIDLTHLVFTIPSLLKAFCEKAPVASVMSPVKPMVPASSTDLLIRSVATPLLRYAGSTPTYTT